MIDLSFTSAGGLPLQTPLPGQITPAGATPSSAASPSLTPPAVETYPFMQLTLIGQGLGLPRNSDDCEALLAEVTLDLQSSLEKSRDASASILASGLTAALAQAKSILTQIENLKSATTSAQAAAASDQTEITQDQQNITTAQNQIIADQTDITSRNGTITVLTTELAGLKTTDPKYALYKSAIAANQTAIAADTADIATQTATIASLSTDLQGAQTDLATQNAIISSDTAQEGQLAMSFLQAFIAVVNAYAQFRAATSGLKDMQDNHTGQVLGDLAAQPQVITSETISREYRQYFAEEANNLNHAGVVAGLALGITDLYGGLQDLLPSIAVNPQEAAILRGQRVALFV